LFVRDAMSKKILSVSSTDSVSKFMSLVEKNHVHETVVMDKKKLKGIMRIRTLVKKGILNPNKTKIKNYMEKTTSFNPNDDLQQTAKTLLNAGIRSAPVIDGKKVVGIITMYDIINHISRFKEFRQTKSSEIMSPVNSIEKDTDIGKARVIMREKGVARLPVVDNKELVGIVSTFDMLKAIKPRERMGWHSMASEMERVMDIPISTIMDNKPAVADKKTSLNEVVNIMNRKGSYGVVITSGKKPEGMITVKDLLEFYIGGMVEEGVYYQIIGLEREGRFTRDTVDRMVGETVRKVSSLYKPDFVFVHVKRYETGMRSRNKYSVRVRLRTNKGMFISKSFAWDLMSAMDEALDRLERAVFKRKDTMRDRFIKNMRKLKGKQRLRRR